MTVVAVVDGLNWLWEAAFKSLLMLPLSPSVVLPLVLGPLVAAPVV